MEACPDAAPVVVAENTTPMVQVDPAASVAPHVPAAPPVALENGPVKAMAMPAAPAVPVLCSVRFCAALVVEAGALNVSEVGATFKNASAGPATNSTAPASTALLVFLAIPKKSNAGAAA